MDAFNKPQLMMWTVVGLVVLNLTSLGTLWWSQQHPALQSGFQPPHAQGRGLRVLEERLNLNEEQTQQLRNVRRQQLHLIHTLEFETHEARRALNEQLFHPDGSSKEELARIIGEKQSQLEIARFDHFQQLVNICNEDQKMRLLELMADLAANENQPPPPVGMRPELGGVRPARPQNMGDPFPPPPGMPPRIE